MNSNSPLTETQQLDALRQQIRKTRKQLSADQKASKDQQIITWIKKYLSTIPRDETQAVIALFLSFDGEPDLMPLTDWLRQQHFKLALPVIDPQKPGKMAFHLWDKHRPLHNNRFGIAEPQATVVVARTSLQFALVPLVAFDSVGNRVGMGGGYYDRYFQAKGTKPLLVGVAYECQRVEALPNRPWDIPLDIVVTEKGLFPSRCE